MTGVDVDKKEWTKWSLKLADICKTKGWDACSKALKFAPNGKDWQTYIKGDNKKWFLWAMNVAKQCKDQQVDSCVLAVTTPPKLIMEEDLESWGEWSLGRG